MIKNYLFISAHLDDAVISCGDYIHELTQNHNLVTIATVFTGMGTELSMLARILHKKFGLGTETMDIRKQEDIHAAETLGASVLHLGVLECIYRKKQDGSPVYGKLQDLFETDWRNEAEVMEEIVTVFLKQIQIDNYDGVYVPLGIGRHVDHCLVRASAEQFRLKTADRSRIPFFYYEDLPYLSFHKDLSWECELAEGLHAKWITLRRCNLIAKINAVTEYRSQLRLLWRSKYHMLKQMAGHANAAYADHKAVRSKSMDYRFKVYAANAKDFVPLGEDVT